MPGRAGSIWCLRAQLCQLRWALEEPTALEPEPAGQEEGVLCTPQKAQPLWFGAPLSLWILLSNF